MWLLFHVPRLPLREVISRTIQTATRRQAIIFHGREDLACDPADQVMPRAHLEDDAGRRLHRTWIAPEITFSEYRKRLQGRSVRAREGYSAAF